MKTAILSLLVTGLLLTGISAVAQDRDWSVEVGPYLWMPGVDGDFTVGGDTIEVEKDFDDVLDALDMAFGLYTETSDGTWFFGAQLDYADLDSDNVSGSPPGYGSIPSWCCSRCPRAGTGTPETTSSSGWVWR